MRDVFIKRLCEIAENNPKIFLITGDLGFKVLDDYIARFPKQFLNVGIAEQNMAGVATGLALEGRTVFNYSIANFPSLRCFEQIRSDICYHNANVKILSIGSGFSYGQLGMSHHGTEDVTVMRSLPGMRILSPCEDWEMMRCAEYMVSENGPFYLRIDKSAAQPTVKKDEVFKPGKLRMVREGKDASIITTGSILDEALKAHDILKEKGISLRVYACHSLKPFDSETVIKAAADTGGIITLEEHTIEGGLGGIVAEHLLESGIYPKFFIRMGMKDRFASVVGSQEYLRGVYQLDCKSIVEKVSRQHQKLYKFNRLDHR